VSTKLCKVHRSLSQQSLQPKIIQSYRIVVVVSLLLLLLLLGAPVLAQASTTVRVVIERVQALDGGIDPDFPLPNEADFYPIVNIASQSFGGTFLEISDHDDTSPNWQFSRPVPLSSSPITITIAMWDRDGGLLGSDDEIDLTPGGDRQIDLTIDLNACAVSGDVSGACWVTLDTSGTDSDNARIWFRIEVGDPPAMAIATLTIERVRDIDGSLDPDFPFSNEADFYPVVRIAGTEWNGDYGGNVEANTGNALVVEGDDDITPNWQFTKQVPISLGSIPVSIEIWDDDAFLTFDDDLADAAPNGGRSLDLTVNLLPCSVSGEVSGGCASTIIATGTESDKIELRFRIEVEPPPSINGFNIRCLHAPLWPQSGQTVTVSAQVLDDNLNPIPTTTGVTVEAWVDSQAAPASSSTNVSSLNFSTTPPPLATQLTYGCAASVGTLRIWSGWHAVQVGTPTVSRAVPVLFTHPVGSAIDIIFVPDRDNFSGANDVNFINAAHDVIQNSYYGDLFFLRNQRNFNFWLAQDMGDYESLCDFTEPSNWDSDYAFIEAGSIIHTNPLRDCARFSIRLFSGTVGNSRVFLHESGHQPFGLADEYCCDGGYFQPNPFPDVYGSSNDCAADSINVGRTPANCRNWVSNKGATWYTSDPASGDLMVDNSAPQALDIRRFEWVFNNCNSSGC
jgi:hypothetical protein